MRDSLPAFGPDFDLGDRVRAAEALGGFWRAKVPRGMAGLVIGRTLENLLTVRFLNGQTLTVRPAQLALGDPSQPLSGPDP